MLFNRVGIHKSCNVSLSEEFLSRKPSSNLRAGLSFVLYTGLFLFRSSAPHANTFVSTVLLVIDYIGSLFSETHCSTERSN